jgi:hypothetical protein
VSFVKSFSGPSRRLSTCLQTNGGWRKVYQRHCQVPREARQGGDDLQQDTPTREWRALQVILSSNSLLFVELIPNYVRIEQEIGTMKDVWNSVKTETESISQVPLTVYPIFCF